VNDGSSESTGSICVIIAVSVGWFPVDICHSMDSLVVARVEKPFTTQNNYLVLHSIYSTVLVDECWWYSLDFLLTSTNSSFPPLLGAVEYVVSFVRWKQSILSKSWSRKKEREKSRVLFGGYTPPLQLVHPPLYPSLHCRYIVVGHRRRRHISNTYTYTRTNFLVDTTE
jgi:hypothetical protein